MSILHAIIRHPRVRLSSLLLLASLSFSCSGVRSFFGETIDVRVLAEDAANNEYPMAMDVVYVYDDELLLKLLQMSAREWFDQKEVMMNSADEGTLAAFSWEWTPGQDTTINLPLTGSASGAVIFVNYFTTGQHRIRIDPTRDIRVELGFDEFVVTPM